MSEDSVSILDVVTHESGWRVCREAAIASVYYFPKRLLTDKQWNEEKKRLTFVPHTEDSMKKDPKKFRPWLKNASNASAVVLYGQSREYYIVPIPYGLKRFGPVAKSMDKRQTQTLRSAMTFHARLYGQNYRPEEFDQQALVKKIIDFLMGNQMGCMIEAPTSSGKTVMACALISRLRLKTLWVVPSDLLLNQTKERVASFIGDCRVGILQGKNRVETSETEVTIAMLKSLSMFEYPEGTFDGFGLVIIDEVHTIGAQTYMKSFSKFSHVRYIVGVSATLERLDRMDRTTEYLVGPVLYRGDPKTRSSLQTSVVKIRMLQGQQDVCYQRDGETIDFTNMITHLTLDPQRNAWILSILVRLVAEGRKTLVIGQRVQHLEFLRRQMVALCPGKKIVTFSSKLGKRKRSAVLEVQQDIILASYSIFGTGTDIGYLDTQVLVTPMKTITQTIGRLRSSGKGTEERKSLLIVDLIDDFSIFKSQLYKRNKIYKTKGFIQAPVITLGRPGTLVYPAAADRGRTSSSSILGHLKKINPSEGSNAELETKRSKTPTGLCERPMGQKGSFVVHLQNLASRIGVGYTPLPTTIYRKNAKLGQVMVHEVNCGWISALSSSEDGSFRESDRCFLPASERLEGATCPSVCSLHLAEVQTFLDSAVSELNQTLGHLGGGFAMRKALLTEVLTRGKMFILS